MLRVRSFFGAQTETSLPQLPFFPFWCFCCEQSFEIEGISLEVVRQSPPECPSCKSKVVDLMDERILESKKNNASKDSSSASVSMENDIDDFVIINNTSQTETETANSRPRRRSSILEFVNYGSTTTSQYMNNFFHNTLGIRTHPNDFHITRSVGDFLDGLNEMFPNGKVKGIPPASEEVLKDLQTFPIDSEVDFSCPICLMEDLEDDKNAIKLPCGHNYHSSCIIKWLKRHNVCPICRFELSSKNED